METTTVENAKPHSRRKRGAVSILMEALPTLVVLALIVAVGVWGHRRGWKPPKFSELNGAVKEADDWCATHSVPESICVECKEDLMPKPAPLGWCKVHNNSECVLCNPERAQTKKPAVVAAEDLAMAKRALEFADRKANNPNCQTHKRRIQFASMEAVEKAGVAVEPVWPTAAVEFVGAPGEINHDQTKVVHLSSRTPGAVWRVFKQVGQDVKAGEVLALVDAAEVGKAKAELLQALAALQLREQTLATVGGTDGAVPAAKVREAEAAVREADIRIGAASQALINLGLPLDETRVRQEAPGRLFAELRVLGVPTDIARTLGSQTTNNLLSIVAPTAGVVSSSHVVVGEVVDASRILFEIVDQKRFWLNLDVKAEEARRLAKGQKVRFTSDAGGPELTGVVTWISTQADPKTRAVKVRAEVADPPSTLIAHTFGTGRVILREEEKAISVPNEAIHSDGCCSVVFVRDRDFLKEDAPKVFHVRKVRVAAKGDKATEVVGVLQGELVATKGSGLMLTELLRGSLGEGCACHAKH